MKDQAKFMQCYPHKSGGIITAAGRMAYPYLFKASMPKGETDEAKARFQVTLLFPKEADLSLLSAAVNEKIKDRFGDVVAKKIKVKKPFLKTEDQPKFADMADDFPVMIRLNAKNKPGVVMPDGKTIVEDYSDVYPGRWARILVNPYCYDRPDSKGCSLGLEHVQLLSHDDRFAGGGVAVTDAFEDTGLGDGANADSVFD